jgi:hypothetical protein
MMSLGEALVIATATVLFPVAVVVIFGVFVHTLNKMR